MNFYFILRANQKCDFKSALIAWVDGMFNFGECVQNPPPPQTKKKKTRLEPIERSCHSFTQMILPGVLQEKILKSKKTLGTPCSSWKSFIIKQFWTYADHTPEILHGCQKIPSFKGVTYSKPLANIATLP